jgi:endo-1,4-beta-xylanase
MRVSPAPKPCVICDDDAGTESANDHVLLKHVPFSRTIWHTLNVFGVALIGLLGIAGAPLKAQVIANGFEDGTTQSWISRGTAALTSSTEASRSGARSLKTTGRTDTWNGPALNLLGSLSPNTTYQISGWVRLVAGQTSSNLKFTVEMAAAGQSGFSYVQVNPATTVTDAGWVQLQGTFSFSSASNSQMLLYLESDNPSSSYFLDDFTIVGPGGSEPPGTIVSDGFEGGTTENWISRGPVALASSADAARTGSRSLLTTGRTSTWNGPALDVRSLLTANTNYQISGWVRLVTGKPMSKLKFTVEMRAFGGANTYVQVNNVVDVTDAGWVQLQGTFSFTSANIEHMLLYLESDDATSAFYLDDFLIVGPTTEEPPPDPTGLATDFETGTAEGWYPRGPVTLTPTNEIAASDSYSLKVTGRAGTWQGPAIDVLGKLSKGSRYAIGVRVRLAPGEQATQIRVSLEARVNTAPSSYHTVIGDTMVTDGAWVDLSALYTFGLDATQLQLYVESATSNASFYIDDFVLDYIPPVEIQDLDPVKDEFSGQFDIGAAVSPVELTGVHSELLLKHFNSIVAGNAMKWDALQPAEGQFNWGPADAIVAYARANNLKLRGHTLLWHSQVPSWVFRDANGVPLQPGNAAHRDLLINRLRAHIDAVVGRYKDDVNDWDVVNEVIDTSGPGGLRNSPWLQIIGPEYIDFAFQFAEEILEGAGGLYINDYNTHEVGKRTALASVVQGLLSRGRRVDGVGHQTHISVVWPPLSEIAQSIDLFTGLGMDNQITELDISAYSNSTDTAPVSQETLVQQGYRYRDLFNLFRAKHAQISSVTFWGMADDNTWLKTFPITRDDKPLLFDEQLQAKPAYYGIMDPDQLPVLPKDLNVTQKPATSVFNNGATWLTVAPVALTPGDGTASSAQFRTLWSSDALYLSVDVQDATPFVNDSVEVFLGAQRYAFTMEGRQRIGQAEGQITATTAGYRLVAKVPSGSSLAIGGEVLFDVRVMDGTTGKKQSWSDTRHAQHVDQTGFGTLHLLPEKRVSEVVRGKPVVDGIADKAWKNATSISTSRFAFGSTGATATVKLLWDTGTLYVFATVTDPLLSKASANPWEEDSIEVFVDANAAQTTTYQSDDAQYRINFDNEVSVGGATSVANVVSATRVVPGGYIVEAAIRVDPAETTVGAVLGFDVQVNDDSGGGVRTSVATWNDLSGQAYQDTSQFGALILR